MDREVRSSYFPQIYVQGIAKDGLSGATGGLGLVGRPASPFFDKLATAVNLGFTALDFGRTSSHSALRRFIYFSSTVVHRFVGPG